MKEVVMFTGSLVLLVFASAHYIEWQKRREKRKNRK